MIPSSHRMLALLVTACAMVVICSYAGAAPNPGGPTRSTTEKLDLKRYVASGDRAYVIGSEDGRFPPMGWHIRGEMGGVWAHPIKLLDGYWFSLNGTWLPPAQRFTTGAGYVQMNFPKTEGLNVTRTEFAPDDSPVVVIGLTVQNPDRRARPFRLTMDVRSELMAAYPWGWTDPNAEEFNNEDKAIYDRESGTLTFKESGKDWYAMVGAQEFGASGKPTEAATGDEYWGPVPPAQRPDYYDYGNEDTDDQPLGTGARLRWNVNLQGGGEKTLWFAVAGSHTSQAEARSALEEALTDPNGLLEEKVSERKALFNKTKVNLPDSTLQAAFDWGKLNMADLTRTVKDMEVRDVDEGKRYPVPVKTIPSATGIGAGFPDYPWYFGTDGAYTAYPLLVSGQWDTIKEHLRTIRDVSRAINGETGKVVHEVVTDGSVYWGDNDDPGNTNETAQFATAVYQVWLWTGDDGFRDEMYPFIVDGMRYITSASGCPEPPGDPSTEGTCDDDEDGWPEGYGMVERTGMGEEKLDVTAYTWQALRALQHMAASRDDPESQATATWADQEADAMEESFDEVWWMGDGPGGNLELYADSLDDPGNEPLQQKHWINATPMEVLLAPEEHANAALDTLESSDFTDKTEYECGLYHTGVGGGPERKGELKCWTLPNSVMAVGEANYGRLGKDEALNYMDAIAEQLDFEMPGALPEIAPSPEYTREMALGDFRERAMFMQAWSSYGVQWPVIYHFLGIRPDVPAGSLTVVPDIPESWPGLSVQNLHVGNATVAASASHEGNRYTTEVSASSAWKLTLGHTLPEGARVATVTLDGKPVEYVVVETTRGREVRVDATTDQSHTLVVTTG